MTIVFFYLTNTFYTMHQSRWNPSDKKIVYDERKLYNYGINRLSVRDYGRAELKERMVRFQEEHALVDKVLDKLEQQGYLSDERRINALFNQFSGRESVHKIKNRMLQKGLDKEMVGDFFKSQVQSEQSPEKNTALELLEKKFKSSPAISSREETQKTKEKMIRFLAGKGFKYDDIKKAMSLYFEVD